MEQLTAEKRHNQESHLSLSLNKIIIILICSLIVGNFGFLWNVHSDITRINTSFEEQRKYDDRELVHLQDIDTKITEGLTKINSRLDVFENRITTLEVLIGMKKTSK